MKWKELKGNETRCYEENERSCVLNGNDNKWKIIEWNGRNELKWNGAGSESKEI